MKSAQPRPRVLVLASTYPRWAGDHEPGFVHELCRRLAVNFTVTALVPDSPDAAPSGPFDGVEIIRYRYAPRQLQTLVFGGGIAANLRRAKWKWLLIPGFVIGQYVAARHLLKTQKIDVIHAHWLLPQGLIARRLGRLYGVPYLVTSHGGDLFGLRGTFLTSLKRRVARNAAAMTVVSTAMRDEVAKLAIKPPLLRVLPMGVDLQQRFVPDTSIRRDPNELLFVGRLVAKKGLPFLLNALPEVLRHRPAVTLRIVGFGPQEVALKTQARRLGVESAVCFTGAASQEQLPDYYRRAALFVAPFIRDTSGDQEGLPVALMEAIGCGCPVLAGNVPGLTDLLGEDAEDVILADREPAQLAQAILGILASPERACCRARQLRRIAVATVDWGHIAEGYTRLLTRCHGGDQG